MFVHKRPGVDQFLNKMAQLYVIAIYTASTKDYADKVIEVLDPNGFLISYRLYRDNCININAKLMLKPISVS